MKQSKDTTHSKKQKEKETNRIKQKVQSEKIQPILGDSGASSTHGRINNLFIQMGLPSTKTSQTPLVQVAQASEQAKLIHKVRE